MKESVLRAAAIASLALALIVSVTTWVGLSTSSQRGSFFIGFFEFALILFLGVVAWALFNAFADVVTVRTSLEVLAVRMTRIEEALGVREPAAPGAAATAGAARPGDGSGPGTESSPGDGPPPGEGAGATSEEEPRSRTPGDREE